MLELISWMLELISWMLELISWMLELISWMLELHIVSEHTVVGLYIFICMTNIILCRCGFYKMHENNNNEIINLMTAGVIKHVNSNNSLSKHHLNKLMMNINRRIFSKVC
eukprot:GHVR01170752.1.p1 GENE.GHVR01170752.1~~GHVR01170752.1.p1  ORF type:complete len:110 (-),score=10.30 GHVR01170752.1:1238-1567(-)